MIRFALLSIVLWVALSGHAPSVQAETRYVTDRLEVTLRTGESTRYRILRMLPSGTPLEILSVNKATNYARVRLEDDTTGYILLHELQDEPVARTRVAELEAQLAELQQKPDALAAQLSRLQAEHAALSSENQSLRDNKQRLEQELATIRRASANILDITNDRDRLRIQVSELTREQAELQQQNRDLRNQSHQRWFLIGAGVVSGGILIGLILPHLRLRRRRSSWGSL